MKGKGKGKEEKRKKAKDKPETSLLDSCRTGGGNRMGSTWTGLMLKQLYYVATGNCLLKARESGDQRIC